MGVIDWVEEQGDSLVGYGVEALKGVSGAGYSLIVNPFVQAFESGGEILVGSYNAIKKGDFDEFKDASLTALRENFFRDTLGLGGESNFGWLTGEYGLLGGTTKILPSYAREPLWDSYLDTIEVIDDTGAFIFTLLASGNDQEEAIWYNGLPDFYKDQADKGYIKYNPFSDKEIERISSDSNFSWSDRIPILNYFDPDTYKQAYAVAYGEEERSFGQAFAALYSGIDPFSDYQYNALEGTLYFNVLSGTADFLQEIFLDPLLVVGKGVSLARGTSAIMRPVSTQTGKGTGLAGTPLDIKHVSFEDVLASNARVRKVTPTGKIHIIRESGFGWHTVKPTKQSKRFGFTADLPEPKLITIGGEKLALNYDQLAKTSSQYRARAFAASKTWQALDEVIENAARGDEFSPQYALTHLASEGDNLLINKRVGALRAALTTRQAKKLPAEALYLIARGATAEARAKTLRFVLGDTAVAAEAMGNAGAAFNKLVDGDFFDLLEEANSLQARSVAAGKDAVKLTDELEKLESLRKPAQDVADLQKRIAREKEGLANQKARQNLSAKDKQNIVKRERRIKRLETQLQNLVDQGGINPNLAQDIFAKQQDLLVANAQHTILGKQAQKLKTNLMKEHEVLTNTDWVALFDFRATLRESIAKQVVNGPFETGFTRLDMNKIATFEDIALDKIVLADVLDYAARNMRVDYVDQFTGSPLRMSDTSLRTGAQTVTDFPRMGRDTLTGEVFGGVKDFATNLLVKPFSGNTYSKAAALSAQKLRNQVGISDDFLVDVLPIPSTLKPLGSQRLTYFTQRVNQRVMHHYDRVQASQQFERMLADANKFTINGKSILTRAEAESLNGQYVSLVARNATVGQRKQLYDRTVKLLCDRADELIASETNIKFTQKDSNEVFSLYDQLTNSKLEYDEMLRNGNAVDSSYKPVFSTDDKTVLRKSGNQKEATTFVFYGPDGSLLVAAHHGVTPTQMAQSSPMPRWDLLEDAINRVGKHENGVFKNYDIAYNPRMMARTARKAVSTGIDATIRPIWTASVLLTPRWAMRVVGSDEQLRFAAVFGALETLTKAKGNWRTLLENQAAKGAKVRDDWLDIYASKKLKDKKIKVAKDAQLADKIALLEKNGVSYEQLIKEGVANAKTLTYKAKTAGGATARLAMSGLVHPAAGVYHAGKYWSHRYNSLNNYMSGKAAGAMKDSYNAIGRELLRKADPDNPAWNELADRALFEGELTKQRLLEAGNREGFNLKNVDDIVDAFEIADTYAVLNDAPTVRIGDNVFQNAMGDTMAHQQMNANQISARRSNKSAMQGIYSAHTRELLELQGGGPVRTYDFVDVPAAKRNDIFTEHWQQWQSPDPAKQRIFNIVFDTELPVAQRIQKVEEFFKNNPNILEDVVVDMTIPKVAMDDYINHISTRFVLDANHILPDRIFKGLRRKAASGQAVKWEDIQAMVDSSKLKSDLGLNSSATFNEVVGVIRTMDGGMYENFAKHNGTEGIFDRANVVKQQVSRLRKFTDSMFETLGTMPSDALSRHPFYNRKYKEYLLEQTTAYKNFDDNYVFTPKQKTEMEGIARRRALEDTRTVMYELVEHTRFAEVLGFASPFFNAWQEVIGRWGSLAFDNPVYVARGIRLFTSDIQAPVLGLTTGKDAFGEEKLVFNFSDSILNDIPVLKELLNSDKLTFGPFGSITKLATENPIAFDIDSLFSLVTSSPLPSTGPLVNFVVQEGMYADPKLEDVFGFMFPYGVQSGPWYERFIKETLPTWTESIAYRTGVYRGNQYETRVGQIFLDKLTQVQQNNEDPDTPYIDLSDEQVRNSLMRDAHVAAQGFGWFKTYAALNIPIAVDQMSPFYAKKLRYNEMLEEDIERGFVDPDNPDASFPARIEITDPDGNKRIVNGPILTGRDYTDARFLAEEGDEFFWITQSLTDSRAAYGIAPTVEGWELYEAHKELIQAHPIIAAFLQGDVGATTNEMFSSVVYNKQRNEFFVGSNEPMRSLKSLDQILDEGMLDRGWNLYDSGFDPEQIQQHSTEFARTPQAYIDPATGREYPYKEGLGLEISAFYYEPVAGVLLADNPIYYNGEGMQDINNELYKRGQLNSAYTDINHEFNFDLKMQKNFLVHQLGREFPQWKDEYEDFSANNRLREVYRGFAALFEDESDAWKVNGASRDVLLFINDRQMIEVLLSQRKNKNLTHESNSDLREIWLGIKADYANRPAFASTYIRYFQDDMVAESTWTIPRSFTDKGIFREQELELLLTEAEIWYANNYE